MSVQNASQFGWWRGSIFNGLPLTVGGEYHAARKHVLGPHQPKPIASLQMVDDSR